MADLKLAPGVYTLLYTETVGNTGEYYLDDVKCELRGKCMVTVRAENRIFIPDSLASSSYFVYQKIAQEKDDVIGNVNAVSSL